MQHSVKGKVRPGEWQQAMGSFVSNLSNAQKTQDSRPLQTTSNILKMELYLIKYKKTEITVLSKLRTIAATINPSYTLI